MIREWVKRRRSEVGGTWPPGEALFSGRASCRGQRAPGHVEVGQPQRLEPLLDLRLILPERATLVALKLAAVPFSILIFLLVYWLLPNGKVPLRAVWPIAVLAGVVVEGAKNLYVWLWPLLGLRRAYGPFFVSVTLLLWGFFAALIVLGGAEMSARRGRQILKERCAEE